MLVLSKLYYVLLDKHVLNIFKWSLNENRGVKQTNLAQKFLPDSNIATFTNNYNIIF